MVQLSLPEIRTDRLTLTPVGLEHLPLLVDLNGDPEVMRFVTGHAATQAETESEWVVRLTERTDVAAGLGYWAGYEHGVFVGWWGASRHLDHPDAAVLGWRLRQDAWGRGLATEGAAAVVEHCAAVDGVARVVASTMAVNHASRRVMEKLGMTHVNTWHAEWADPIEGAEEGDVDYERALSSR